MLFLKLSNDRIFLSSNKGNRMRKGFKIALATILLSSITLMADGYRIEFKKALDSNAEDSYIPDIILPIQWNENYSSSFEYRSGEMVDKRLVEGYANSNNDENIEHKRFKLNALNYRMLSEDASYTFGIGASYEQFDKRQVGYVNSGGGNLNFDNNIKIDTLSLYLKAETIQHYSWLDIKLYGILTPVSNLDVKQDTYLSGIATKHLQASSSESQDISYEVDVDFTSKLNSFADISLAANYRFLPTKYNLDSGSGGVETKIDEITTLLSARILFNFEILSGWMPTIGYSQESVKLKDKSDSSTITLNEDKIYIGVNTRF